MPRIRTIKPEFFKHEGLAELSPLHRLLFIGLWTVADRFGRTEDRPKRLKAELLPYDKRDVDAMLQDLHVAGFIVRYEVDGGRYIEIPSFAEHQRITGKEAATPETLPGPPGAAMETHRGNTGEAPETPQSNTGDHRKGREGKGREGKGRDHAGPPDGVPEPAPPVGAARASEPIPVPRTSWLDLVELWNRWGAARIPGWTRVDTGTLPAHSQGRLLRALRECPNLGVWEGRIARAASSDHLTNRNGKGFVADLWWLIDHVAELDAGRFDNRARTAQAPAVAVGGGASVLAANDALLERIKQRELAAAGGAQ